MSAVAAAALRIEAHSPNTRRRVPQPALAGHSIGEQRGVSETSALFALLAYACTASDCSAPGLGWHASWGCSETTAKPQRHTALYGTSAPETPNQPLLCSTPDSPSASTGAYRGTPLSWLFTEPLEG